ncbi:hypothetical protein D3C75_1135190 [compost metagenome]
MHNGACAVLLLDGFQPLCGVADGFVPTDRFKLAAFFTADQRLRQARRQQLGIVEEVPAVVAFQAQFALIGCAVGGFCAKDFTVIHHQFHFAACATVRADGRDFFHWFSS